MHRATIMVLGVALLTLAGPAGAAGLGEAAELEAARANARAGGPISERDKELLERYGCLSGTRSSFCEALEGKQRRQSSHSNRIRSRR